MMHSEQRPLIGVSMLIVIFSAGLFANVQGLFDRYSARSLPTTQELQYLYLPMTLKSEGNGDNWEIQNAGFELGTFIWGGLSEDMLVNSPIHGGMYSARLGSLQNSHQAYIYQQFLVPWSSSILTYWSYTNSNEFYCPEYTRYDFISIQINGSELLKEQGGWYALCDDGHPDNPNWEWVKRSIDLSNYEGRMVNFKMTFESDGTLPTDFFVDDFAFE